MKVTWKLLFGFILVSLLSAFIAVGTYSHLNKSKGTVYAEPFNQGNFRAVGFANAAENTDFTKAAEQSINGVVHIKSIANPNPSDRQQREYFDPFEFFFGGGGNRYYQRQPRIGFGSGVIISTDGYIVTNNHVIDGADEIEVTTNSDKTYKAKLVGRDEATDVALLKIDGKDLPVIPFGNSDALKIGEWVLAIGNPFNLSSTVTAGIVSAKGRGNISSGSYPNPYIDPRNPNGSRSGQVTQQKIESYIQTDAAVNPGNSGGALVNTRGELVGINTAIYSETGNYIGYSFAIPISIVKKVVTDIKQYGTVQRALLGVLVIELPKLKESNPDAFNKLKVTEGVYVDGFSSNSSTKKAGIEVGDVITAINDVKVKNFADLQGLLSRYNPGDKVTVQVQRGNSEKTFKVELKNDQGTTEITKYQSPEDVLGASFKELSKETKMRLGINFGVEVTGLSDGKLKTAGIKNGFIILTANDTRISTSGELIKIVQSILKQEPDNRGLFIRGFYPNTKKVEYIAIDLNY
ncbi:MAG: trypsin-like peptidase domain-containing protein [Dysgonamonadaceae bacterium]|jgi:S1-C subfamily serine protease|nr:trypsin-like peptidase domain-containing protein [Dysgonamonadaceae bacterium]